LGYAKPSTDMVSRNNAANRARWQIFPTGAAEFNHSPETLAEPEHKYKSIDNGE
jgi:hypothetical protein